MSDMKSYVAVQNFSLNLDNGKNPVDVKVGDIIEFDGLYASCRGEKGQARLLTKVIGEWVQPYTPKVAQQAAAVMQARPEMPSRNVTAGRIIENSEVTYDTAVMAQQRAMQPGLSNTPASARPNMTAGRIVESSDVAQDASVIAQQRQTQESAPQQSAPQQEPPKDELQQLVEEYEQKSDEVLNVDGNEKVTKETKKPVVIENSDAAEVMKTTQVKMAGVQNTSGVQIEQQKGPKAAVISEENTIAKKTTYPDVKKTQEPERKKLVVDRESEGKVVRKTSVPVKTRNEVSTGTVASGPNTVVTEDQGVALETQYDTAQSVDVGSTTQTQTMPKTANKVKVQSATRRSVVIEDQGVMKVVRKGSRIRVDEPVPGAEGITAKLTVGPSDDGISTGEVTFGDGDGGIELGEATVSGSGDTATDLTDIDLNDILR